MSPTEIPDPFKDSFITFLSLFAEIVSSSVLIQNEEVVDPSFVVSKISKLVPL